jgi:hypothetical protein
MSADSPAVDKPEEHKGFLDKLGAALPVGLTALATAFAGMSTSELQRAMYWKSQAAQDQSRATNQWSYAGFKRDRALIMQTTASQLRAAGNYAAASFTDSSSSSGKTNPHDETADKKRKDQQEAIEWLQKGTVPPAALLEITDEHIIALQNAIKKREPEAETLKLAGRIKQDSITKAIDDAEKKAEEYDREWSPILSAAAKLSSSADGGKPEPGMRASRQAMGYDLEERRYRAESQLNQGIGYLYEIRVRVSSAESDKHRHKSELFFYAMLAAQIGATISALALARRTKSLLWLLAGGTGLIALGIGAYVYLAT